jgi:hypothetical protein
VGGAQPGTRGARGQRKPDRLLLGGPREGADEQPALVDGATTGTSIIGTAAASTRHPIKGSKRPRRPPPAPPTPSEAVPEAAVELVTSARRGRKSRPVVVSTEPSSSPPADIIDPTRNNTCRARGRVAGRPPEQRGA